MKEEEPMEEEAKKDTKETVQDEVDDYFVIVPEDTSGHDPTIPSAVMGEIEKARDEENPIRNDDDEGGVASSDEEVI